MSEAVVQQQALLLINRQSLAVSWSDQANALKEEALSKSGVIGKVSSPEEMEATVAVARELQTLIKTGDKARSAANEDALKWQRNVNAAYKSWVADIEEERTRLDKLVGDYAAIQQAKARAVEALRQKELAEAERKRQEDLAKAANHEELEAAHEKFNSQVRQAAAMPMPAVPKAKGVSFVPDVDFVIEDMKLFCAAHWNFVTKVDVDRRGIKEALKAGMTLMGVKSESVTKSSYRTHTNGKAIEV